jgi:phospholipid/cholesterol/gamma-HCH transport system substrate-binding protein
VQSVKILRNPTLWGVAALASLVVIALVVAMIYINPPGQKTVAFYTKDASSISPGDTVRIAGITVGKVTGLSKEPNQVKVNATVDGTAFVGDQSQVEVRMLTVVGGYYVNIVSLGDQPLGKNVVPTERVTLPYNLMQTLTDATDLTNQIDAKPARESLHEIQQGLTGTNTAALSAIIDAGNSLTATIEKQRGQISAILNLSDEYIQSLSNFRGQLRAIISKIAIVEQTLILYGEGFANALQGLGAVGDSLVPVAPFYWNHREKFIEKVRNWQEIFRSWADRNGLVLRGLRKIRNKLDRVLDAQNARPELLATDICIPMPGSPC